MAALVGAPARRCYQLRASLEKQAGSRTAPSGTETAGWTSLLSGLKFEGAHVHFCLTNVRPSLYIVEYWYFRSRRTRKSSEKKLFCGFPGGQDTLRFSEWSMLFTSTKPLVLSVCTSGLVSTIDVIYGTTGSSEQKDH